MSKTIEFTEEEFFSLIVLVKLGSVITSGEDETGKLDQVRDYVYSNAERFNCGDLIERKMDVPYSSDKLTEIISPFLDSYEEMVKNR